MDAKRIVNVDVKDSGSWRRVSSFNLDDFEDGALEHWLEKLFELSTYERIGVRIIIPGDTAPLMTWNKANGWKEWRHET